MWNWEICAIQSPGTNEAQGIKEDPGQPDEDKPEPDPSWSEAPVLHAGQAPLHENSHWTEDVWQQSLHGHIAGECVISLFCGVRGKWHLKS